MILDLHVHSDASDDSRASVEGYMTWLTKRPGEPRLDGIVLTEHRQFDLQRDLRSFEDRYGIRILRGAEIETDYGHMLVFGVNRDIVDCLDFTDVRLPAQKVITEVSRRGGVVIPCHPGRPTVGLCAHYELKPPLEGVVGVEALNGGSRKGENERTTALMAQHGYGGCGGSDAHMVSFIGICATVFERPVRDEADLVLALIEGRYRAIDRRQESAGTTGPAPGAEGDPV